MLTPSPRSFPASQGLLCAGFTLVELIITLVIGSILLSLAIPPFQNFVAGNRMTSQTNDLIGDLTFARSEAMKRSQDVRVCVKQATADVCESAAPQWRLNRVIWVDTDADGTIDATEIIRRRDLVEGGNAILTSNIPATIVFRRNGFTNVSMPATGLANHFKICDGRKNVSARVVLLDATGRVRASREAAFLTGTSQANFVDCPNI